MLLKRIVVIVLVTLPVAYLAAIVMNALGLDKTIMVLIGVDIGFISACVVDLTLSEKDWW